MPERDCPVCRRIGPYVENQTIDRDQLVEAHGETSGRPPNDTGWCLPHLTMMLAAIRNTDENTIEGQQFLGALMRAEGREPPPITATRRVSGVPVRIGVVLPQP